MYTLSYCIITATIYELLEHFQSIYASFSPDFQPNITFFTGIIAIGYSLKNPLNISVYRLLPDLTPPHENRMMNIKNFYGAIQSNSAIFAGFKYVKL